MNTEQILNLKLEYLSWTFFFFLKTEIIVICKYLLFTKIAWNELATGVVLCNKSLF